MQRSNKIRLVFGEDSHRVFIELQRLREEFYAQTGSRPESFIPSEDPEGFLFGTSLFSAKRLLILELGSDGIEEIVRSLSSTTQNLSVDIVFYCYGKLDRRLSSSKIILQLADEVNEFETFKPWKGKEICSWLNQRAKLLNIPAQSSAIEALVEAFGNDTARLESELMMLHCVLEGKPIDTLTVKNFCEFHTDVFKLLKSLYVSPVQQLPKLIENFCKEEHTLKILAGLQTQLDYLYNLKILSEQGCSQGEIAERLGKHAFRIKQDIQETQHMNSDKLRSFCSEVNRLEYLCKDGLTSEDALRFKWLLLRQGGLRNTERRSQSISSAQLSRLEQTPKISR